MAPPTTLYRFQVEVSDVDRGVYESLDFRAAQHPSESLPYLLTRVLAFVLNADGALAFTPGGLSDPDEPALRSVDANGTAQMWIEIGNPSARRLHKASKSARQVKIYTYKDPDLLLKEIAGSDVHRAEALEIFSFAPKFLEALATKLERNNGWSLIHNDGLVTVTIGDWVEQGELVRHHLL
ncbi:MAG: YaeQ family protein [Bdellovibrionales bacterium]|nr:YaeQ family protein [Bdellovibrionales bacterium]